MPKKTKLELTWIGKDQRPKLEPRILIEDPEKSYHAKERVGGNDIFDNMLIHGDNLLALKALEQEYAGKVKCIYIDPPYNTGQAFEHYDDGIEISLWLTLMKERLNILRRLLAADGAIFVQIDDNNFANLRLLLDEIFGAQNYINTIAVKTKDSSGASGGGEDRRLKKNIEFILAYGGQSFDRFNPVYNYIGLKSYLQRMRADGTSFKYTSVFVHLGEREYIKTIPDGSGKPMKLYKITNYETKSIGRLAQDEGISEADAIKKYYRYVHTTENAQTSIRTRVQEATDTENNLYALEYFPISGRNKGKLTELLFVGPKKRLVSWFHNVTVEEDGGIYKRDKLGTYWADLNWNNVTREGGVRFPNGQKPEKLISICLELATNEGDLILDSFLGSGTTAAVAHKMKRKWIGIELGKHCDSHCIPRLKAVIDNNDARGITDSSNWKGGGGFRYYELGPSLIEEDKWGNPIISKEFDPPKLTQAMCKLEGFDYAPAPDTYWMQGHSSETDFIYVTSQTMSKASLAKLSDEVGDNRSLLVCCPSFRAKAGDFPNLTLKKIPKAVLKKCEWGRDDYSLQIQELHAAPVLDTEANAAAPKKPRRKFGKDNDKQVELF